MRIDTPFYLAGIIIAMFAGYQGYAWYYIFISSALMTFGFFLYKIWTRMLGSILSEGVSKFLFLLVFLVIMYAAITAVAYYLASLFS